MCEAITTAMLRAQPLRLCQYALSCALALANAGCNDGTKAPALSRVEDVVRAAPIPPEDGPRLGVVAERANVREFTDTGAPILGFLRAGALLPRSPAPVSRAGCAGGWYAVRPRGFVCVGVEATVDLAHPTLAAMALAPNVDASLPYTYARTRVDTPLFERTAAPNDAVREVERLHRRAGMAVVGSWKAKEPSGNESRLALLTDGHFARASDLEAARPSDFSGIELGQRAALPVAFVVKRGVRSFELNGSDADKGDLLEYHSKLFLSGRFRTLGSTKYFELKDPGDGSPQRNAWLRYQDITPVQKRTTFPDFVRDGVRWVDVSTALGTLVAYEGKRAVFATLVSVARDLPETGTETEPASAGARLPSLGTFSVVKKSLTLLGEPKRRDFAEPFEINDVPWVLELSSGRIIHGAYWHDRFGIEHGAGSIELSPADAARLFAFVGPDLPRGWHGVNVAAEQGTPFVIRK